MQFSKTLTDLAAMSLKVYAEKIRKRNKGLLKKLMILEPYVDKPLNEIPDKIFKEVLTKSHVGCPHCNGNCCDCLWTKATHSFSDGWKPSCTGARFDSITLSNIMNQPSYVANSVYVFIYYSDTDEHLSIGHCSDYADIAGLEGVCTLNRKSWEKCVRFVKAHIEWTKLPCWGTKIKRKKTD